MKNAILTLTLSIVVSTLTACSPPVRFSETRVPAAVDPTQNVAGMSYLPNKPLPESWVNCAQEDGVCYFEGTKKVRFGVPGAYVTKNFFESVNCSVFTFGHDPNQYMYKGCDVEENYPADTFEPLSIPQQINGTTDLNIQNVSDMVFFVGESNGVSFDWGYGQTARSYLEYEIEVQAPGVYDVVLSVASEQSSSGFNILVDTVNLASIPVANTGSYGTYANVGTTSIPLSAGVHRFRLQKNAAVYINVSAIKLIKN